MPTSEAPKTALLLGAFVISLAAAELATRSFLNAQPLWGAFYLAITLASLLTVVAVRCKDH